MLKPVALIVLVITLIFPSGSLLNSPGRKSTQSPARKWGALANPRFDGQPVRTILFFAGQQLDGQTLRQNNCQALPVDITAGCKTAWPSDQAYLDWKDPANRVHAVQKVVGLGFNTISMSTWGESWLPCTDDCPSVPHDCCGKVRPDSTCRKPVPRCFIENGKQRCRIGWYGAANTQLSPAAKNELFDAAAQQPILIMPFIESRFDYDWNFRTDFPTSQDERFKGKLAPGLISQIEDLIATYLKDRNHPEWRDKWAQVYDQYGEKRYAVVIVQASSDSIGPNDDQRFAAAFDQVAGKIFDDTQIRIGFFIDPIARNLTSTYSCPGIDIRKIISTYAASFRPDPEKTGPWLRRQSSILGIHAYSPEGWVDGVPGTGPPVNECFKIAWKEDFSRRWYATGIPFLQDVTPGYDGTKLNADPTGLHRWGYNTQWCTALLRMTARYGQAGLVYNSWNGYCEGLAAMETQELGSFNVDFIRRLMANYLPFGPDTCKPSFVWREAVPDDHVCVPPISREAARQQNREADAHRLPNGGAFGPDTCVQGFVWRDAFPGDHVCVTPAVRRQVANENSLGPSRRVAP